MNNEFEYKTENKNGISVTVRTYMGGLQWLYENKKKERLSIILHDGSYGRENGLFEIMPSWRKPEQGDEVKGYLTFGEVQEWINEFCERA